MDGVSSASAVVALTVQLISTTRDILTFLKEIKNSPDELHGTIEVLQQLRRNLEVVKCLVEEQSSCVDLPLSIESIHDALEKCESKVKEVEQYLNKFKGVIDCPSQVGKKWASFKLVLKKREIKGLQDKLKSARSNLQMALDINANRLL